MNTMSAPSSSSVPSTSASLTSPTDSSALPLPGSNVRQGQTYGDPPGFIESPPPLKYLTSEVYLLPREWTPSLPGTFCFPSYPEDMVPKHKPPPSSARPDCQRRQAGYPIANISTRSGPKIPAAGQLEGEEFFRFSVLAPVTMDWTNCKWVFLGGWIHMALLLDLDPNWFVVRFGSKLVRC